MRDFGGDHPSWQHCLLASPLLPSPPLPSPTWGDLLHGVGGGPGGVGGVEGAGEVGVADVGAVLAEAPGLAEEDAADAETEGSI